MAYKQVVPGTIVEFGCAVTYIFLQDLPIGCLFAFPLSLRPRVEGGA